MNPFNALRLDLRLTPRGKARLSAYRPKPTHTQAAHRALESKQAAVHEELQRITGVKL